MDSISSIARISRLIRSKRTNGGQQSAIKPSAKNPQSNSTSNPSSQIAAAIRALPARKQTEGEGIEILIHGILDWKFGENALEDPLIRNNANKVMESILNDKVTKKATQQLIKEILNKK